MIKSTTLLLLMILGIGSIGKAQNTLIEKLVKWKDITEKHDVEYIHIHTNQPYYVNHDTIWFKSYVVDGLYNKPSSASKLFYVELIDRQGKQFKQAILPFNSGLAKGYFALTENLSAGLYYLVAYTSNMKSYGPDYAYQKPIVIIEPNEHIDRAIAKTDNPSFQFFPEGGDLVHNMTSLVGFKAVDANGSSIEAKGDIIDENENIVASFSTEHAGIGSFLFTPKSNHVYSARIKTSNGGYNKIQLPHILPSGYTLNLKRDGNNVRILISSNAKPSVPIQFTLVGSQNGVTRFASQVNLINESKLTIIPDSLFYNGVTQFTLFEPNGNPIAERLFFVSHDNKLKIKGELAKQYKTRQQVTIPLTFTNIADKAQIGSFSVSVYNQDELYSEDDNESNIYTDMLLNADIKGYIETPAYYFRNFNDSVRMKHLDNLLLTQGWRHFSWKNHLSDSLPTIKDNIDQALQIKGHVYTSTGKALSKGKISLYEVGNIRNSLQTETDENGRFVFDKLFFSDTGRFVISTNTLENKKKYKITIDDQWLKVIPDTRMGEPGVFTFTRSQNRTINSSNHKLDSLLNLRKTTQLKEVNITAKKKPNITESANLNGAGKADVIITADDLNFRTNLSAYLQNFVVGLKSYDGKIYSREIPNGGSIPPPPLPMLIVKDGQMFNQDHLSLSDIDPNSVASIEVLKNGGLTSIYGPEGAYGVLVITSKKGLDYTPKTDDVRLFNVDQVGYQSEREFYSPTYPSKSKLINNNADFRKAIYWNPNIVFLPGQQTQLSYFNSDYVGKYKVVIEGISVDGDVVRTTYEYLVTD